MGIEFPVYVCYFELFVFNTINKVFGLNIEGLGRYFGLILDPFFHNRA
ncbi:hypothetical protein LCGC14_2221910 [marine sediment metagenome]|uniref:Uncharacterized protein n=1 Tax=marine sediment metagenome TaxID=412755 RepID=A0A0F9G690_9ZZZZ